MYKDSEFRDEHTVMTSSGKYVTTVHINLSMCWVVMNLLVGSGGGMYTIGL